MLRLALLAALAACGSTTPGVEPPVVLAPDAAPPPPSAAQVAAADRLAEAYLALAVDSIEPTPAAELALVAWTVVGAGPPPSFSSEAQDNADLLRGAARAVVPGDEWRAIAAMAAASDDSVLLDAAALGNVMAAVTGQPHAAGGFVAHHDPGGAVVISEVLAGGPAEAAGVLPGDVLVSVDSAPPGAAIALPLLYHPPGTRVDLEIDRGGQRRTPHLELTAQTYPLVSTRRVKTAAVIRIRAVVSSTDPANDTAALTRAAIAALDQRKVRGIVVDLRGCPGGEGVAALASVFTTNDPLLLLRDVAGAETPWARSADRARWPHWIAVLVDDQTASAAEMVAFAMREQGGIKVFGQPTLGEMSVPGVLDLGDGNMLVYPAQLVVGPISRELPSNGRIDPDSVIANRTAADVLAGKDAQLDAAVKWATRKRP